MSTPADLPEAAAWLHRQGNYTEAAERQLDDDEIARGWTQEALFTAAQMRAFYAAGVRAGMERAAVIAKDQEGRGDPYDAGHDCGVSDCVDAIERAIRAAKHEREQA